MADYFDRTGAPINPERLRALMDDRQYRLVADSSLTDGHHLTTEWVGFDHRTMTNSRAPAPLIFESELYPEREVRRYATEKEARSGHEAWVTELQGKYH